MSGPFATSALWYLESGLGYPIPSMYPYEKHPPLTGWTGRNGSIPSEAIVREWQGDYPDSNVLIRMAPDVIGIDVDNYDDKRGAQTKQFIEIQHGVLPETPVSSARALPSGIYWFRLRTWMDSDKMRDPGEHVEVIRYEHRYAVAPNSWHQGARARYQWHSTAYQVMPQVGDLAYLPTEWYIHLNRGCECFETERADRKRLIRRLNNRPKGEAGREHARRDLDEAGKALALTSEGGRNNMLSSIAGRFLLYDGVLNNALDINEICVRLKRAGLDAGLESREIDRTIESAFEWAEREGSE